MKFGLCMMEIRGLGAVTIALTNFSINCMNVSVFYTVHMVCGSTWIFGNQIVPKLCLYDCALFLN